MATSAERQPDRLVDTSVAVAAVTADHVAHRTVFERTRDLELGLSGHAAFECVSVLTRLPPPSRRGLAAVTRLLESAFPHTRFLPASEHDSLYRQLSRLGIAGGSVYDALVGSAAVHHELPLLSRDRRASRTYQRLGVDVEFIDG